MSFPSFFQNVEKRIQKALLLLLHVWKGFLIRTEQNCCRQGSCMS
ncbi:hypothetical protein Nmel_007810 [Mimus melanotis]